MKKRILVVGTSDTGKRDLINAFGEEDFSYVGQDLRYTDEYVYIPSGYLTNPWMYGHIITIAQNQGAGVLLIIRAEEEHLVYPPEFAKAFNCQTIGIVLKKSVDEDEDFSRKQLIRAGIKKNIFSIVEREDNRELKAILKSLLKGEK